MWGVLFLLYRLVVEGSKYGQLNYGHIWTGNMGCSGNESNLQECRGFASAFGYNTSCNRNASVGIICNSMFKC